MTVELELVFGIFSMLFFKKYFDMSSEVADNPPSKRKRLQWRDEDMVAAMEAESSGGMTITASSRALSVPRKTLDDRMKGHVSHGKKPGVKLL